MAVADRIYTNNMYNNLRNNPLLTLQGSHLWVNGLPPGNDARVTNLWFAARNNAIAIDAQENMARGMVNGTPDCAIQRQMAVSPMRSSALLPGAGVGGRHHATGTIGTGAGAHFWVTELQTGCTVLILGWAGNQYSMLHLQPSQAAQFNRAGQVLLNMNQFSRSAYQNAWLKQEATTVVQNTGAVPQRYIMIQSMFETSRGSVTQVIGVLQPGGYEFYRQLQQGAVALTADHLQWSTWRSYMPYFSY